MVYAILKTLLPEQRGAASRLWRNLGLYTKMGQLSGAVATCLVPRVTPIRVQP